MIRFRPLAAFWILALSQLSHAQTPAPFDTESLLAKLNSPTGHDEAVTLLKQVGEEALVPLWQAAESERTPPEVRKDIQEALPDIYSRLRDARAAKEAALASAWKQKQIEYYNTFGKKDAKWDVLAIAALTDARNDTATVARLRAARDAGCNDPLIRLLELSAKQATRQIDLRNAVVDSSAIMADMAASGYPDSIKFMAHARMLKVYASGASGLDHAVGDEVLAKVLQLAPAFFAEKPGAAIELDYLRQMLAAATCESFDHKATFDSMLAVLSKSFPNGWQLGAFSGWFHIQYGFDARGEGFAVSVTPEGQRLFRERVEIARKALEKGFAADPLNSSCAAAMISVCNYQGTERSIMEGWFQKAMLADPDCWAACNNKRDYLTPRWNGSVPEMLAFGRECVAKGNGRNGLPNILLEAVREGQVNEPGRPIDLEFAEQYMKQPQVWADVKSACEKLLADKMDLTKNRDQYLKDRGLYLRFACQCSQWETVLSLAQEFGDEINLDTFGGKVLYTYYLDKARAAVAKQGK